MSNGERAHNFTPDRTPGATFARGLLSSQYDPPPARLRLSGGGVLGGGGGVLGGGGGV
jgi:hypothetical protein